MAPRGRRPGEQTKVETKLAAARVLRGMTQAEVAAATGIPLSTYWKLERDEIKNPGIRDLANCAIVLGCKLEELIDDGWTDWWYGPIYYRPRPAPPAAPKHLWRKPYWETEES